MILKSFLFSTHVGRKPWIRIKYLGWSILYRYVLSHRIVFHGGLVMKGNESHNDHFLFWAFGNFKLRQSASDVTVSFYWTFREHLNIVQCILHYQDCSGLLWSPSAASDALLRLQCPPISPCWMKSSLYLQRKHKVGSHRETEQYFRCKLLAFTNVKIRQWHDLSWPLRGLRKSK